MHTFADDRGFSIMSVFDHLAEVPGQVNTSWMYAGAVKAWHRHILQDDHWVVLRGNLKIGLYNTEPSAIVAELRLAGPTPGTEVIQPIEIAPQSGRAVYLAERRAGVLRIPHGLWHGGVAVGGVDALLLYYMTRRYNAEKPDEERSVWNAFPFDWGIEFK